MLFSVMEHSICIHLPENGLANEQGREFCTQRHLLSEYHPLAFDSFLLGGFNWFIVCFFPPEAFRCIIPTVYSPNSYSPCGVCVVGDRFCLTYSDFLCCVSSGTCEVKCYEILEKMSLCLLLDLHFLVKQNVIFSSPMLF